MITCQKCGKENQDHYKFCLGCGAELTREEGESRLDAGPSLAALDGHTDPPPDPVGVAPMERESTRASPGVSPPPPPVAPPRPPAAAAVVAAPNGASERINCPQCGHENPTSNRFCASCGYKLNLASVPAKTSSAHPSPSSAGGGVMLTALRADGSEAGTFPLAATPSQTVGRDTGSIFAGDSYLSPRHATFSKRGDQLFVGDASSLNGVYLKIRPNTPWSLKFGDIFRIGQEILRLEKLEGPEPSTDGVQRLGSPADGYVARLGLVIGRDTTGNAFPVPKAGLHLGRERGDVLFPEDGYVSGLHCRIGVASDDSITLTDLGSSNGSFVRLEEEQQVTPGDILLMGQQLFRIDA